MDVFDAVVVGSGAAGGWAAKKLTEAGLRVALVEAGPRLDPAKDFTEHQQPYDVRFRNTGLIRSIFAERPIQSAKPDCDEHSQHLFVKDTENPYTVAKDRPFDWIRSRHVGGKTITWRRVALRMSDLNFKAASRDGFGIDWPIAYADLAPFYDEVEEFIGVSGSSEGTVDMPAGKFQPPMALSCGERRLAKVIRERYGRTLLIAPTANLTKPLPGRAACHYCGPCHRGCVTGAYFSSPASTLPAAERTGRLTLFTDSVVSHVTETDEGLARGVWCVDRTTRAHREVRGRVVVMCASTLESTRILLNSRSSRHPAGLGNGSGVLGHYLTDHVGCFAAAAAFPSLMHKEAKHPDRPACSLIARFRNLDRRDAPFLRGYHYQLAPKGWTPTPPRQALGDWDIGPTLTRRIEDAAATEPGPLGVAVFGEGLARYENHCRLDEDAKDAWGIPALHIDAAHGENERLMCADAVTQALEMLEAAGARIVARGSPTPWAPGGAVHEVGTARMGADRKTSYLNAWNQSHEVKNLFVLDGASFSSSANQNPTLTIMALAARASTFIAAELQRRNL